MSPNEAGVEFKMYQPPGGIVYYIPGIWEVKAGGSEVQDQP